MMTERAQVSPVITERRKPMITETCARSAAEVPHHAYPRNLYVGLAFTAAVQRALGTPPTTAENPATR